MKKRLNKLHIKELFFDGRVITGDSEVANAFNDHFASAGSKIQAKIPVRKTPADKIMSNVKEVPDKLHFVPVTEIQLCKIVDSLKSKKSCGLDGISNVLLKRIINVIKLPLCSIINRSLAEGVFPDLMKIAKIKPLFKSGDMLLPDNFRPISLLPVLSKVLERVVFNCVMKHVEKHNIVFPRQFGFRKKHSTIDAIMNLVGETLKAFDNNMMVMSVFIDLKKAFDTVSHKVILSKLEKIGIKGVELDWFKSYLSNRWQVTDCNGTLSSERLLNVGVQQGSLLGVFLFQLIINDMPKYLKFSGCILYADDTTLFVLGRSLRFIRAKLQADLARLSDWLIANSLKINVSKTKSLLFNKEGLTPNVQLMMDGEPIDIVRSFKLLGITLESNLSFDIHFRETYDKLQKSSFLIRSLCKTLPAESMKDLYYAYYDSPLTYGSLIWYPLPRKSQQSMIYLLQKRIIRSLSNASYNEHCMPLFKKLNILTLNDAAFHANCKFIFKLTHDAVPDPIKNMFTILVHPHATRGPNVTSVNYKSRKVGQSFLSAPFRDWQSLNNNNHVLANVEHVSIFAKKLKENIISKY